MMKPIVRKSICVLLLLILCCSSLTSCQIMKEKDYEIWGRSGYDLSTPYHATLDWTYATEMYNRTLEKEKRERSLTVDGVVYQLNLWSTDTEDYTYTYRDDTTKTFLWITGPNRQVSRLHLDSVEVTDGEFLGNDVYIEKAKAFLTEIQADLSYGEYRFECAESKDGTLVEVTAKQFVNNFETADQLNITMLKNGKIKDYWRRNVLYTVTRSEWKELDYDRFLVSVENLIPKAYEDCPHEYRGYRIRDLDKRVYQLENGHIALSFELEVYFYGPDYPYNTKSVSWYEPLGLWLIID